MDGARGLFVGLCLLLAGAAEAASVKRAIQVSVNPPTGTVSALLIPGDGDIKRAAAFRITSGGGDIWDTGVLKFYTDDYIRIVATAPDYQPATNTVTFIDLRSGDPSEKNPLKIALSLEPLKVEIPVEFVCGAEARIKVKGVAVGASTALVFTRETTNAPWQPVPVQVERPQYKAEERSFTRQQIEELPITNGLRQVVFALVEIERQAKLAITANEPEARVSLDSQPVTNTPCELTLTFARADASQAWSSHMLRVEKDGYEYRPAGMVIGLPVFQTNLTHEVIVAMNHRLALTEFQPMRCFEVPMHRFAATRGEVRREATNSISAKDPKETSVEKLLQFSRNTRGESLVAGRIAAILQPNTSGKPGEIVVALLATNPRADQPSEVVGSQIWRLTTAGVGSQITVDDPGVFNIDPCITKDGKTVYFSSNRRGQRGIWKKPASSGGALFQIDAGKGVDVDPAVFTTSENVTRVAFTRYLPGAAVGTPPIIVVQDESGQSCAETQPGRSPAWSNDGTKIAYVSPRNRICVMDSTGEHAREITSGSSVDDSPVWLPGDREIVYASARADESRNGTGNYDLWKVDLEGTTQQLISNSSFDGMPTVTSEIIQEEGKQRPVTYIYFLSNRGAQKQGEESWSIRYFEMR
jgi:hypothetical protein